MEVATSLTSPRGSFPESLRISVQSPAPLPLVRVLYYLYTPNRLPSGGPLSPSQTHHPLSLLDTATHPWILRTKRTRPVRCACPCLPLPSIKLWVHGSVSHCYSDPRPVSPGTQEDLGGGGAERQGRVVSRRRTNDVDDSGREGKRELR